jgi:hypothetical protein
MKLPAEFTFDSDEHQFFYKGELVPSVTQILKDLGFYRFRMNKEAADRGTFLHQASVLYDKGILDPHSVPSEWFGWMDAYQTWYADFVRKGPVKLTGWECLVFNSRLGYAGIVDKEGRMQNRKIIIDLKTGSESSTDPIQLLFYAACYGPNPSRWPARWVLYTRENGSYKFYETFEDPITLHNILQTYGRKRQ